MNTALLDRVVPDTVGRAQMSDHSGKSGSAPTLGSVEEPRAALFPRCLTKKKRVKMQMMQNGMKFG